MQCKIGEEQEQKQETVSYSRIGMMVTGTKEELWR